MEATIQYADVKAYTSDKSNFWGCGDHQDRHIQGLTIIEVSTEGIIIKTDPHIPDSTKYTLENITDKIPKHILTANKVYVVEGQKHYQLVIQVSQSFKDNSARIESWTIDFLPQTPPAS